MARVLARIDAGAVDVAPRHRAIVRRWRTVLDEHGAAPGVSWDDVVAVGEGLGQTPLDRFFARCDEHLEELVSDDVRLQALLFDEGSEDAVSVLYSANPISELTNAAAGEEVRAIALETAPEPARILEIGAGTGATTGPVLDAVADQPLDYRFTDVSEWFLERARTTFAGRSGMSFGLYDLNAIDPPLGPWDGVVAGNVLHNVTDPVAFFRRLRPRMSERGRLVLVETGTEHHPLLISMRFMMSPPPEDPDRGFTDARSGDGRIFLTPAEWEAAASSAGWTVLSRVPDDAHPLAWLGQFTLVLGVDDSVASP
ncbi:class I SAM-dependent methyltransferase [Corynebacterium sp.]|uniref:class I SAM-dependent methyltransferase n=1 Tax=Corynebacterium sp. TaxID=1720 RepID=UPI0026DB0C46|nr:class I SAM-dependent methyltransferase [Corynebacterium sp.]MDO4609788.1 class I SAM-dependent methyltransferase [Corynebacterium sp.]